jgi:hypothetical protein
MTGKRSAVLDAAFACRASAAVVEPAKLIGPMLARFMPTDRAFAKLKRGGTAQGQ